MTRTQSLHERQDTHEYFKLAGRQFPVFYQCLSFSKESFCSSNPENLSVIRKAMNTKRQNKWTLKKIYCKNKGNGENSSAREHNSKMLSEAARVLQLISTRRSCKLEA